MMYYFVIPPHREYLLFFYRLLIYNYYAGVSLFFLNLRMSDFCLEPQTSNYRKNISRLTELQSDTSSAQLIGDDFCGLHACKARGPLTRRLSLHKCSRLRLSCLSPLCGVITALSGDSERSKQILLPRSLKH